MIGWGVRVEIPLEDLGRVRLPTARMHYRDGWVRVGLDPTRAFVVATLEDREGHALAEPTVLSARIKALRMGRAIAVRLMEHNRYDPGERPGRREQVLVAT